MLGSLNKRYNVGLYIRLSREDDDKTMMSESITNQKSLLLQYVKENNLRVYDIYVDDGYSGTNFDRPDFNRLLKDIELGKIKIKHNGSSAGHNGIKNIIDCLGTENFVRIRVGIGKKPDGMELNNYVLGKFSDDEKLLINNAINEACEAIKFIITENVFAAMNKFNTRKGVVEN